MINVRTCKNTAGIGASAENSPEIKADRTRITVIIKCTLMKIKHPSFKCNLLTKIGNKKAKAWLHKRQIDHTPQRFYAPKFYALKMFRLHNFSPRVFTPHRFYAPQFFAYSFF